MTKPSVFISYSHDSEEHAARVLRLSNRLREHGIDAELDQYHTQPTQGWPRWCEEGLRPENADFVLVICTPTYLARVQGKVPADEGRGVYWEGSLLYNYLYSDKGNERFLLVLFDDAPDDVIPAPLNGYNRYRIQYFGLKDRGYEDLYRTLTEQPRARKPALGERIELETRGGVVSIEETASGDALQLADSLAPQTAKTKFDTPKQNIAHSRLLDLGVVDRFEELVGREAERRILDEAWNHDGTHILVFVAEGGVGKTSLVADWMMGFVKDHWERVDAFFDWSFYSQGTQDQSAANSGQFMDAALRHFGESELADSPAGADLKADRLAERVASARTLLLLDGVEPLQHPRQKGQMDGRLKDTGLERLLKQLAQLPNPGGLCVLTTRVPLVDLNRYHGATVREEPLHHLSYPAAAQLLHQAGARRAGAAEIAPDNQELLKAAEELHGHALAAQLLGGYLKQAASGDILGRDQVDWSRAFAQEQEGHARSLMAAYEHWFQQQGADSRRQLAALRLLGLFDRPASAASLDALRSGEPIAGLTEPLTGPDQEQADEDWNRTLTQLAEGHRLVSLSRRAGKIEQVDAHPLVREHFAARLREEHQAAWTQGHRCLYQHLCATTEHRPDSLEGLKPLYQAVAHGCRAGLHEQARADVYRDRILRGTGNDGFYSTFKLGAMGADLGAVACFFERPWGRPSPNVSAPDRAWLLNQAAFRLRALGRLTEALEPMRAGLEMAVEQEDWANAAMAANNLSQLELTLGDLTAAIADAGHSATLADRSGDEFQRMYSRTSHADALHQAGRLEEARRLFAEAEAMEAERQPAYPRLYSLGGFLYCDLLLSGAECAAWRLVADPGSRIPDRRSLEDTCDRVAERAKQWFEWRVPSDSLLTIALDHLTLARTALYRALLIADRAERTSDPEAGDSAIRTPQSAIPHLAAAVDGLRKAGASNYLPRGLLTRAWHRHLSADPSGAASDLNEAREIAERGPMPLYQADILLTRVRLFGTRNHTAGYPWGSPQADLAEARRLIDKHGYHRRDQELADAEAALGIDSGSR